MIGNERASRHVERPFNSLADLRLSEATMDSVLGHISDLGVAALPGWDAAAATIVEGGKIATYGATDERVQPIDQHQYDAGRGPCVDAMRDGATHYFDGSDVEPRWRQFAEVAGDAGVYSVVSFPLQLDGEMLGALNFYSSERDALRAGQREEGSVFAAQAAVTLANAKAMAERGVQVAQLQAGLETRAVIGQATGLLMAQEGLSSEEAFQKLVKVSQTANMKLRDIAQRYVDTWESKATASQLVR